MLLDILVTEGDLMVDHAAQTEDDLISIVDGVLETDDYDNDGYISFYEFISSQGDVEDDDSEGSISPHTHLLIIRLLKTTTGKT